MFKVRGYAHRLIVAVACGFEAICIKFVGTHAPCDAIDASRVDSA